MAEGGNQSAVANFISVTGSTEDVAVRLLEACNNDLQLAVNMFLETGAGHENNSNNVDTDNNKPASDSEVRAPIPQKHEILVDDSSAFSFRNRRRKLDAVVDGLRDFRAEALEQENGGPSTSNRFLGNQRLDELFRPPLDLLFKGTFQMAKDVGTATNKWLLVNLHDVGEFSCQVLNRDVWKNQGVKDLVKQKFLLWQISLDSEEGRRYIRFYPVRRWPYVAVLDPRTGENCLEINTTDVEAFKTILLEFLLEHPTPSGTSESPVPKRRKVVDITDMDEEKQLQEAMKASLQLNHTTVAVLESDDDEDSDEDYFIPSESDSESSDVQIIPDVKPKDKTTTPVKVISQRRFAVEDTDEESSVDVDDTPAVTRLSSTTEDYSSGSEPVNGAIGAWKSFTGSYTDPMFHLLLRLPDNTRQVLELPSSSQLRAVLLYVAECGYSMDSHELVIHFPRRCLSSQDPSQTLEMLKINHRETIYVQET